MELPPFVRLPEKMVYKEPPEGVYIAQPFGKQCYVWFTEEGCFMVDIHKKKRWPIKMNFDPVLKGTIVLGTIVYQQNAKFILIYDIFLKLIIFFHINDFSFLINSNPTLPASTILSIVDLGALFGA